MYQKTVAHVFFVFFSVCFEQSMSFFVASNQNQSWKKRPGRPGIHQSFVDEFGALDSGLYPPWNWQQKHPENGGPPGSLERNLLENHHF